MAMPIMGVQPLQKPKISNPALNNDVSGLQETLKTLYPSADAQALANTIVAKAAGYASPTTNSRPKDWYKDEIIYRIYPDAIEDNGKKDFYSLIKTLPQLKQLGVTTLYILPFLKSPMGDGGFDVSDFMDVRDALGGMTGFDTFAQEAKKMGFKLKADLVLNHVSQEHPWFKALIASGQHADKFCLRNTLPEARREVVDNKVIMHYKELGDLVSSRLVIFSDAVQGHYRSITINKKPAWAYHTFYPFQMDINWTNPDVMLHMLDVVGMWAKKGVDIFRLDGFNYLIKAPGHNGQSHPLNQSVIKLINTYLKLVKPDAALLAEVEGSVDNQTLKTYFSDGGVNLTYAFPMAAALWDGLLTEKAAPIIQGLQALPALPAQGQWVGFLRNHDELMLGNYLPAKKTADLIQKMGKNAHVFRDGLAVGGRLGTLLNNNPDRQAMAQALLLSLPMTPELYYGDEWGLGNNTPFANTQAEKRKSMGMAKPLDARDFNRGSISWSAVVAQQQNPIRQKVHQWITLRNQSEALRRGLFTPISVPNPGVVAFNRVVAGRQSAAVYHNLTGQSVDLGRMVKDTLTGKTISQLKPYQSAAQLTSLADAKPAQWHIPRIKTPQSVSYRHSTH